MRGGEEHVRKFLEGFMDDTTIDQIMLEISGAKQRSVWDRLSDVPPPKIASFLQSEHPQTIAIILSKTKPAVSAGILELIEKDLAQTIILRLSRPPAIETDALKMVENTIETEFLSSITRQSGSVNPIELIGDLMNNISGATREEFLGGLEAADASLAQNVMKVMFTFADIVDRLNPRDVAIIVKETDEATLMTALRYASDSGSATFEFMLTNLSKRLAERMREDIEALEPVKDKDGETAQMAVIAIIQEKSKSGDIKLIEADEE